MNTKEFIIKLYQLYKGKLENKMVLGLLSAGTICIIAAVSPDYIWPIIAQLCNTYLETKFNASDPSVDYIVLGVLITVGLFLYACAIILYFKTKENTVIGSLLQIRHSSIESTNFSKINKDISNYQVDKKDIDQKLEMKVTSKEGIERALYIQEKVAKDIIHSTDGNDYVDVDYYGLAHIPFTILLGYQIADKIPVKFHEWNQNKNIWEAINSKKVEYPPLLLENKQKQEQIDTNEVVLKVGMTYPIPDEDLRGLSLEHLNTFYLHLEKPHRNNIISSEQLQKYKEDFRNLLDDINQKYINLKKIHLFYSGQPSFAYYMGSTITQRMDKEIVVYNHVGSEFPKYNWNLNLKKVDQPITVCITKEHANVNV
ncbi:SAVED domain-containing protein [Bacillus cereus]|uniref:SAVED domain-containing protein n=1 Tax=Bacillus cereus TaxID=1396 RepID=UPI00119E25A0|nr:SAVED domain-containing protein [Bacillus cereus]